MRVVCVIVCVVCVCMRASVCSCIHAFISYTSIVKVVSFLVKSLKISDKKMNRLGLTFGSVVLRASGCALDL